jgi:hypothetical protein
LRPAHAGLPLFTAKIVLEKIGAPEILITLEQLM